MPFRNVHPEHARPTGWEVFRWAVLDRLLGRRRVRPAGRPAPRVDPDLPQLQAFHGSPRLTWIGHASFLVQFQGVAALIDPVFAARIGLFYPRHVPPGLRPDQLPPIDLILLTHNHYDHLDEPSLGELPTSATVVVPLGLGEFFCRRMFARIVELGWWDTVEIAGLRITLTPARHWSRRTLFDTNESLWGGYVLQRDEFALYHAGDSAWFDGFAEVGRRFPDLDAALLPIGGYEPNWFMERNHLNPEQAGQAFLDCGARRLIPMHWGVFQMTDEPLCEPVERLRRWWATAGISSERQLLVPAVGETIPLR